MPKKPGPGAQLWRYAYAQINSIEKPSPTVEVALQPDIFYAKKIIDPLLFMLLTFVWSELRAIGRIVQRVP